MRLARQEQREGIQGGGTASTMAWRQKTVSYVSGDENGYMCLE